MTLRKILFTIVLGLFSLTFLGIFAINVHHFRNYLILQTQLQAQNAANNLSVVISQHLAKQDITTVQTLVEASFDTGNYQKIIIKTIENKILLARQLPITKTHAPTWFVNLTQFNLPPAQASISTGWKQYGEIYIFSNTTLAIESLWDNTISNLLWLLIIGLLNFAILYYLLHLVLKPLAIVKKQAEGIANKHFTITTKLPRTKELRIIMQVMNNLSHKAQHFFESQTESNEKLQKLVYRDPVTNLGNRQYFMMQLNHLLTEKEEGFDGALLLVEFLGFDQFKAQKGYQATENYTLKVAKILEDSSIKHIKAFVCRLSDTGFVMLQPHLAPPQASKLAQEIINEIALLHPSTVPTFTVNIGVAIYRNGQVSSDFLAQADMALRSAQANQAYSHYMHKAEEISKMQVHQANQWREILSTHLSNQSIEIYLQPVVDNQKQVIFYEALQRIRDEKGNILSAANFLPMAESLNMISKFDKLMIQKISQLVTQQNFPKRIAVNFSTAAIVDTEFLNWLNQLMADNTSLAKNLIIEVPELVSIHASEKLNLFIQDMAQAGCEITIDHFGKTLSSFQYLKALPINYLKIHGGFCHQINTHPENQFFVQTLVEIAHSLDIAIIAINIETEQEFVTLKNLHMDAFQGFYLGEPMPANIFTSK